MRSGFTLIELLVVITIIVVLLALLTPALDKAIYQAELAVCGTKQKAAINGLTLYAMNHNRRYAPRKTEWSPPVISLDTVEQDERPEWRPYFSMDALQCSLAGDIDLDKAPPLEARAGIIAAVTASSNVWAGWRFNPDHEAAGAPMMKIGDRWGWRYDFDGDGQAQERRYNWLVNDSSVTVPATEQPDNYSAHPDYDGVFTHIEYDYEGWDHAGYWWGDTIYVSWAGWWGVTRFDRGPSDFNAGGADGAVIRLNNVPWNHRKDERVDGVGYTWGGDGWPDNFSLVPRP